ncbi:MAG: type II secretion system F family protein [bacterium]|nr:type II secretion system F family protein [bacterium]
MVNQPDDREKKWFALVTEEQKKSWFKFNKKVPIVEKIFFVHNIALMIRTGFSISDALSVIIAQIKSKQMKKVVNDIHNNILQGESFSSSLEKHPYVFDNLFVSMVAAGEISGNLENTLKQLAMQMKKAYSLRKKIRNALTYPVLILVFMIVMGTVMFIFIVPTILELYEGGGYTLPLPTRIIIAVSEYISANFLTIASLLVLFIVIVVMIFRTKKGKFALHTVLLKLPIIGQIIKNVSVAKITRTMHSLIVTDIPIVKSYEIISNTVGNLVYKKHLIHSSELLTKGTSVFTTIADRPDLFDNVIAQMIKVGEDTGTLDEMTAEVANFYEEEVDSTMSNLTVIIEPVLMIFIGLGVGFLAVAIIMPIYGLVEQV